MAYIEDPFIETARRTSQKRRRCLRCQTEFDSVWAGDRICTKCKQTAAWRSGQPAQTTTGRSKGRAS
jgi:hypothetical protein